MIVAPRVLPNGYDQLIIFVCYFSTGFGICSALDVDSAIQEPATPDAHRRKFRFEGRAGHVTDKC